MMHGSILEMGSSLIASTTEIDEGTDDIRRITNNSVWDELRETLITYKNKCGSTFSFTATHDAKSVTLARQPDDKNNSGAVSIAWERGLEMITASSRVLAGLKVLIGGQLLTCLTVEVMEPMSASREKLQSFLVLDIL